MTRPRRPVLAAVCAVLLLATVALWVRSFWYCDTVNVYRQGRNFQIFDSNGTVIALIGLPPLPPQFVPVGFFHTEPALDLGIAWAPRTHRRRDGGMQVTLPLWIPAAISVLLLGWFWRGRTAAAAAGFPVEAATGGRAAEAAAGGERDRRQGRSCARRSRDLPSGRHRGLTSSIF